MLPSHKAAFLAAADELRCRIYIRQPNELSDWYIGKGGYAPRNEMCRAETADNPGHFYKGLVVNPEASPDAFLPSSLERARRAWKDFETNMPPGFMIDNFGAFKGLVKYFGKALHTDYEVVHVSSVDEQRDTLFWKIRQLLNEKMGVRMISQGVDSLWQSGDQMQSGFLLAFGPGQETLIIESAALNLTE